MLFGSPPPPNLEAVVIPASEFACIMAQPQNEAQVNSVDTAMHHGGTAAQQHKLEVNSEDL